MSAVRAAYAAAERGMARDKTWRGWAFWLVTTDGGHSPAVVASEWSAQDVHDAYYDLLLRRALA